MYKLNCDFNQYNNSIAIYFNVLMNKTRDGFQQQIRNGQVENIEHEADVLVGCIRNLEEYLYYNFQKFPQIFNQILSATMNNLRTILVLPKENRGVFGQTQPHNKTIYINPDLHDSRYLTAEERTRLYMAHELGHNVNHEWMKKVKEYTDQQMEQGRLTQNQAQLIYDGFSMLDEVITQNRAENFVYAYSGKRRPDLTYYRNARIFDSEPYKSNFDYYGELEEPAIMFARTLRGIGKENDDIKALDMLSERALSPNFFSRILNEYTRDGQMPVFVQEVQYMGLLKRASYANFGYGDISYLINSKTYLERLKNITAQMRDYREPFGDDYNETQIFNGRRFF